MPSQEAKEPPKQNDSTESVKENTEQLKLLIDELKQIRLLLDQWVNG